MKKIFFLEFFLTTHCNQKCYYCNIYKENKQVEVDETFFEYIIKKVVSKIDKKKVFIEFSGGEPGLVKNLYNLVEILKKYEIGYYQIMSNGLVRLKYDWWEEIPFYKEHLIYQINDKEIQKFYDLDFVFTKNIKNVIVMDKITTESLIKNFKYFRDEIGIINPLKFWYKPLVPKGIKGIGEYEVKLQLFYKIIGYHNYYSKMSINKPKGDKILCAIHPPNMFIDLETNEIGHCGLFFKESRRFKINDKNLDKMINFKLFKWEKYCENCYLNMRRFDSIDLINTSYNKMLETYE